MTSLWFWSGLRFRRRSSSSIGQWIYIWLDTFEFINAGSDTAFDIINTVYHDKPLILIRAIFLEKLVCHHQAVKKANSCFLMWSVGSKPRNQKVAIHIAYFTLNKSHRHKRFSRIILNKLSPLKFTTVYSQVFSCLEFKLFHLLESINYQTYSISTNFTSLVGLGMHFLLSDIPN